MFVVADHKILSLFVFIVCQEFKQQRAESSYKKDFSRIEINRIYVSTVQRYINY